MNKLKIFAGSRTDMKSDAEHWMAANKNINVVSASGSVNDHGYGMTYIVYTEEDENFTLNS
jgi:hypothetical protein